MAESRKTKLSISLSRSLLTDIDREAKQTGASRSGVIEAWLEQSALRVREAQLAADVIAYYETRTAAERREDERLAHAMSAAARRVKYEPWEDEPESGRQRAPSRVAARKRKR